MSFRLKTVLGIAFIEALLLTILVISGLHYLSSSNAQQLEQRAATTAKLVATMTGDAVIAVDLATLDVLVEQALLNPDIVYLRIRSASDVVLSQGGDAAVLDEPFTEDGSVDDASNDRRLDIQAPITVGGTDFGRVELGLSTAALETTFADALKWMVGIALSEMGLVALLGLALGHYLTHQLTRLNKGAEKVAGGEFGYQIPVVGRDELAATAQCFNSMSTSLADYAAIAEKARQDAEAGRAMAESTLKDALDSMGDGVLVADPSGEVILANASYRTMYGLGDQTPKSVEAAFAQEALLNDQDQAGYVMKRLTWLENLTQHPRWEVDLTNGRHLLVSQHPMTKGGVVIVQTDVSELYQALEENRQLHLELVQKQRTEAMNTLAGGVAHEINTPAQIIADNARFVAETIAEVFAVIDKATSGDQSSATDLKTDLDAMDWADLRLEIPESLADLADGTARVRDLVSTFKQLAAPGGEIACPTDLAEAVYSVVEGTKSTWQRFAELEIEVAETMPPVPCQVGQIKQVIHHLLVNAVHAIEDKGGDGPGLITIRLGHEQSEAMIEVCDNGCGIPPADLGRIYDVMFTTKEPGRGTGQGLALCQTIVGRGHGGRIIVDSTVGHATCFKVMLPLTPPQAADSPILESEPADP